MYSSLFEEERDPALPGWTSQALKRLTGGGGISGVRWRNVTAAGTGGKTGLGSAVVVMVVRCGQTCGGGSGSSLAKIVE